MRHTVKTTTIAIQPRMLTPKIVETSAMGLIGAIPGVKTTALATSGCLMVSSIYKDYTYFWEQCNIECMANMFKNLDLFQDEPDAWRRDYWAKKNQNKDEVGRMADRTNSASVETVKKPRDKEGESADFFKAQRDMAKDILPKQTIAEDKMKMTPTEAFMEVYPNGKQTPQSMALKPTVSGSYPSSGYSGKDGVPQGNIGTLMLDVKGNTAKWVGDHYLPKETQDNKQSFVPPKTQISAWDAQKFDDGGFQVQGEKCNKQAKANIGTNIGNLIEEILTKKNMNTVIDWSASIASTKEKKALNKPFKTPGGKACYAVYTKNNNEELVRVDFNACKASDPTDLGPTWLPKYWGSKVDETAAAAAKEMSMDDFWNFYSEKVTDPKRDLDWDGKTFYRQADLLRTMPELVNSKPSYEDETVMNKDKNVASSAPVNPARAAEQAKQQ